MNDWGPGGVVICRKSDQRKAPLRKRQAPPIVIAIWAPEKTGAWSLDMII